MKTAILYSILIPSLVCLLSSCREEIVSPDNPALNKNEIVKQSSYYTYSFSIDAQNITFENSENPGINSLRTRLTYYLAGYGSGTADITVFSNSIPIYSGTLNQNINGFYYNLSGHYPTNIIVKCSNFTGKLKVQLSRL